MQLSPLKFIKHEKKSRISILRLRERGQEFQLKLNNRFGCLNIEEAGVDERYQLISDTLMEMAAEIAPQGKRKKQITEKDSDWNPGQKEERIKRNTGHHKRLNILSY